MREGERNRAHGLERRLENRLEQGQALCAGTLSHLGTLPLWTSHMGDSSPVEPNRVAQAKGPVDSEHSPTCGDIAPHAPRMFPCVLRVS